MASSPSSSVRTVQLVKAFAKIIHEREGFSLSVTFRAVVALLE